MGAMGCTDQGAGSVPERVGGGDSPGGGARRAEGPAHGLPIPGSRLLREGDGELKAPQAPFVLRDDPRHDPARDGARCREAGSETLLVQPGTATPRFSA